ncbi:MAG: methyltransferase domain-containing protein [Anaerolineae bacterium]|nr:methyltransferase domain-containing protein [Anaerolineae bacterium]
MKKFYTKFLIRPGSKNVVQGLTEATRDGATPYPTSTPAGYKQAAIDYPHRLPSDSRYYLYTKPFDCSRDKRESVRLFHGFASMLEIMALPPTAKILEVACGSGWLTEFLARSGYDVTGIDISPGMIQIAHERIESVQFGPREGQPLKVRFLVGDAETTELDRESYHAAIFCDSLHHFPNPQAVLDRVFLALKPGGKLYITEGINSPRGSQGEKKYVEVMIRFGTLEKPFDQAELLDLLKKAGFVHIQAYEAINLIVKRSGRRVFSALSDAQVPFTNTILAYKPGGEYSSAFPNVLRARIRLVDDSPSKLVDGGEIIEVTVSLKNVGDSVWLSTQLPGGGFVTLGTKLLDAEKRLLSDILERTMLPEDVPPGQTVVVKHSFTAPTQPGQYWIRLDAVDEQVTWFEQEGSRPFEFPIKVRA